MTNTEYIKEIQKLVGTAVDGIVGPKTLTALCNKLGVEYKGNTKDTWKVIQAKVGTTTDGIFGPKTGAAVLSALGWKGQTSTSTSSDNKYKVVPGDHVIVDIGHADGSGANGNGLNEHTVNIGIAALLKNMLQNYGARVTVLDFPEKGNAGDLTQTVKTANSIKDAKVLISLHSDCASSASAKGGHVCYRSDASKVWADKLATPIRALLPGRADRIVYRPNLMVLKVTSCPAILVEGGFISNPHDADIMRNHPEQIAKAYFDGLTA